MSLRLDLIRNRQFPGEFRLGRIGIIEGFDSLIWTEHWRGKGEFKLKLKLDHPMASAIKIGDFLRLSESDRVMRIFKESSFFEDGFAYIEFSGPSLEYIFKDRYLSAGYYSSTGETVSRYSDSSPSKILQIHSALRHTLTEPDRGGRNYIPNLKLGYVYGTGNSSDGHNEPEDELINGRYRHNNEPQPLDEFIDERLGNTHIGLYLTFRRGIGDEYYLGLFAGRDRTSRVVMNSELDPLRTVRTTIDASKVKTHVVVTTVGGTSNIHYEVSSPVPNPYPSELGYLSTLVSDFPFNKRYQLVTVDKETFARDVEAHNEVGGQEVNLSLENRPLEALNILYARKARVDAKAKDLFVMDIDEVPGGRYVYGKDYELADRVSIESVKGDKYEARVVSYTFAVDSEGVRGYPTLELIR